MVWWQCWWSKTWQCPRWPLLRPATARYLNSKMSINIDINILLQWQRQLYYCISDHFWLFSYSLRVQRLPKPKLTWEYWSLVNCCEMCHVPSILANVLEFDLLDEDTMFILTVLWQHLVCVKLVTMRNDDNNHLDVTIHQVFISPPEYGDSFKRRHHNRYGELVVLSLISISLWPNSLLLQTCKSTVQILSQIWEGASKRAPRVLRGAKPCTFNNDNAYRWWFWNYKW